MNNTFFPLKYKINLIGPKKQFKTEAPADTCSQISIASGELLEFLGYKENNLQTAEIRFLSSNHWMAKKARVKVISESKTINLDMYVIPGGLKSKDVILGADFLKAVNFLPRYIKDFSHLYNLIKKSRHKCVLILGDDRKNLKLLYQIKECLRNRGYEGILLKDYPDIEEQSIEEKMSLFGHLAKFVICENSIPSGHIDELNICTRNRLVTVILQKESIIGGATWMQACYPIDFAFVKKFFYNTNSFNTVIDKAVKMAESLVAKKKRALNKEYKYREEWFRNDMDNSDGTLCE